MASIIWLKSASFKRHSGMKRYSAFNKIGNTRKINFRIIRSNHITWKILILWWLKKMMTSVTTGPTNYQNQMGSHLNLIQIWTLVINKNHQVLVQVKMLKLINPKVAARLTKTWCNPKFRQQFQLPKDLSRLAM